MKLHRVLPKITAAGLLILLSACSGEDGGNAPASAVPSPSAAAPTATATPQPSPSPAAEDTIAGTGVYVGQIDAHSVEIETEEGPVAFELGPGLEAIPETLEMEDKVNIEYVEIQVGADPSVVQRVLSKLEKAGDSGGSVPEASPPASTKTFKLSLEGMEEEKSAALYTAADYDLYVFDIFTFDPQKGRLAMKVDPGYYADIVRLPEGYDLGEQRKLGNEALATTGKITELDENERSRRLAGVKLYLTATGDGLTRQFLLKEVDGHGYAVTLNIPQREASEGFGPHVFASLGSLMNR